MTERRPSEPPRAASNRPTVPGPDALRSEIPDTADIDFSWEFEAPPPPRRPREMMPTLHDEDPLRHDVGYTRDRDATRESMPTLPDIDPLRHDVEPDPEQ